LRRLWYEGISICRKCQVFQTFPFKCCSHAACPIATVCSFTILEIKSRHAAPYNGKILFKGKSAPGGLENVYRSCECVHLFLRIKYKRPAGTVLRALYSVNAYFSQEALMRARSQSYRALAPSWKFSSGSSSRWVSILPLSQSPMYACRACSLKSV